jgi:hypothetical protein
VTGHILEESHEEVVDSERGFGWNCRTCGDGRS